jgi:hypothetical protein
METEDWVTTPKGREEMPGQIDGQFASFDLEYVIPHPPESGTLFRATKPGYLAAREA